MWARPPDALNASTCLVDAFRSALVSAEALDGVLEAYAEGDDLPAVVLSPSRPLCPYMGDTPDRTWTHAQATTSRLRRSEPRDR